MKKFLLMVSCAVAFIVSCSKTEQEQLAVSNGAAVSITSAEIPPVGGEVNFVVSSNVPWSISDHSGWVQVSKSNGFAGTTQVSISADINRTYTNRSAQVTIVAKDGSFRETIDVFQEYPYLELSTDDIDFLWNNSKTFNTSDKTISIICNTDWELQIVSNSTGVTKITDAGQYKALDWLLCSQVEGKGNATLKFNPANYNISSEPHSMKLLAVGPLDSYEIDIDQDNLRFLVDLIDNEDNENLYFRACNTPTYNLQIDSELDWYVESMPSWLTLSQKSGDGERVATSVISIEGANPSSQYRSGELILTCDAGTDPLPKRVISVSQDGYQFVVSEQYSVDGRDYADHEYSIVSSGAWRIDSSTVPNWLGVSVLEGAGIEYGEPKTLGYIGPLNQNFEFSDRVANVKVYSTEAGNNMSKIMKFTQAKYQLEAVASQTNMDTFSVDPYGLNIYSDGEWKATISYEGSREANWLQLSQTTGDLDTQISYRALTANETAYDRTATIILHSVTHDKKGLSNAKDYRLSLVQRKYVFEVSPTPQQKSFAFQPIQNSTQYVDVVCSSNWTVTLPDWVIVEHENGGRYQGGTHSFYGDARIGIIADDYTDTTSSRSGKITIASVIGEYKYNVTQEAYKFNIPDVDITMGPEGGTSKQYSYTCSGSWYIQNCPSWITFSPASGAASNSSRTFKVTVDLNTNTYDRQAQVYFVDEVSGRTKTFKFTQSKFIFDSATVSHKFDALSDAKAEVSVSCTGAWVVDDCPDWVVLSSSSGSGDGKITLSVKNNVETAERKATLVVRSTLAGYTKKIIVTQSAFVFDSTPVTVSLTATDAKAHEVAFDHTGGNEITISGAPSWLKNVSGKATESKYTLTFTSTANTAKSARTATVTLTSKYNSNLKKVVTINQAAAK
ncbi:MAG: BACON domain-containing protein [Alistipes sp.]|nr:BACON domain-containing protein [Alistipes sp.]